MSGAIEIAAVGLRAQQRALETIAGNISNINTPAFKRSDLRFAELVSTPAIDAAGQRDSTAFAGVTGVGGWAQPMINQQGALQNTGSALDVAIDGKGFIALMGSAGRTLLWRGGTLRVLDDGLLATASGLVLKDGITLPRDASGLKIDRGGIVYAIFDDGRAASEVGKISLVKLADSASVERLDGGGYAVGEDVDLSVESAGEEGLGYFAQGAIERSNVDLNEEMVDLLVAQRAYAANAQVVRAVDEFLSLANGLRR